MADWTAEIALGFEIQAELPGKFHKRKQSRIIGNGLFAYIQLSRGAWARIDAADVPLIEEKPWALATGKGLKYARTDGGYTRLHNVISGPQKNGMHVDHIDGDGLNNTRINLRDCTPAQNQHNKRAQKNSRFGLKGISTDKRRPGFVAIITVNKKQVYIGRFPDLETAKAAYAAAAHKYFGEFARPGGEP